MSSWLLSDRTYTRVRAGIKLKAEPSKHTAMYFRSLPSTQGSTQPLSLDTARLKSKPSLLLNARISQSILTLLVRSPFTLSVYVSHLLLRNTSILWLVLLAFTCTLLPTSIYLWQHCPRPHSAAHWSPRLFGLRHKSIKSVQFWPSLSPRTPQHSVWMEKSTSRMKKKSSCLSLTLLGFFTWIKTFVMNLSDSETK